jgi:hypothetical protein
MSDFSQKISPFSDFRILALPASLYELVAAFGGLSQVPIERWAIYEAAMHQWNLRRIFR